MTEEERRQEGGLYEWDRAESGGIRHPVLVSPEQSCRSYAWTNGETGQGIRGTVVSATSDSRVTSAFAVVILQDGNVAAQNYSRRLLSIILLFAHRIDIPVNLAFLEGRQESSIQALACRWKRPWHCNKDHDMHVINFQELISHTHVSACPHA